MKQYPTIQKEIRRDLSIYAFDKLDGSNIRAEWTKKTGFSKFGSKKVLIDASSEHLGEATTLVQSKYADDLAAIFVKQRWDKVTCFFEFFGPNSFAGQHADEEHDVVLIDINPHKRGFLPPREFLKVFRDIAMARLLHLGNANKTFEESVRNGELEGMTFEGVVCKINHKPQHRTMFKIKSAAWIKRLREFCAGDENKFNRLL